MRATLAAGWHRVELPGGFVVITTREGGHSGGDYAGHTGGGANMGDHVGDSMQAVSANRELLRDVVGTNVGWMRQVHGAQVAIATESSTPTADAMVVDVRSTPALAAAVVVADCVPIGILATDGTVGAVIHAGRPGFLAGVVSATVAKLREGYPAQEWQAVIGPSICGQCYEVEVTMAAAAIARHPEVAASTATGTPALNIRAGVIAQLNRAGIALAYCDERCTLESPDLYSYRRQKRTGRQALVVVPQHAGLQ